MVLNRPEFSTPASGVPEAKVVGPQPLRALIIGSGLALGGGSTTHNEALTGHLARALAVRTGRGAVVENRAGEHLHLDAAMADLGVVGAHSFELVVWCPSLLEGIRSPARGRLGQTLQDAIRFLRSTAATDGVIVLTTLPVPSRAGADEEIARLLVSRFIRAISRVAAEHPGVVVVEAPELRSLRDTNPLDSAYYQAFADEIAEAAARVIAALH